MAQIVSAPASENFFLVYNSINDRFNHHVVLLSNLWKKDLVEISLINKELTCPSKYRLPNVLGYPAGNLDHEEIQRRENHQSSTGG